MTVRSKLKEAIAYLPARRQQALSALPASRIDDLREIRLRIGRPMQIICGENAFAVSTGGSLLPPASQSEPVTRAELDAVFGNICAHSVHSWQEAIRQGFITIAGGSRVGICGSAVMQNGRLETVRAVSGMNIRIASERIGCAEELSARLADKLSGGVLIAGAPGSGKTTMLRDLARIYGDSQRVCVLDARGELAAVRDGIPQFSLGAQTDIFDGYPKETGIEIAVRVMAPQILICDELGSAAETEMLLQSLHTGVQVIASAHAGSLSELEVRPQIARLIAAGAFRTGVLLGSGARCGQVLALRALQRSAA